MVAADGDERRALALCAWQLEVASTSFALVQCFEVLVRNAVDRTLGAGQPQAPLRDTWLLDFDVLAPSAIKQVIVAVERLGGREPIARGRVVAHLSFGFWSGLFGGRYEVLWQQRLARAFPGARGRKDISGRMASTRRFRNAIAHHDPLLDAGVADHVEDILTIAGWVDPAAPAWLRRVADVEGVLARRP